MAAFPVPPEESKRLDELRRYDILDTAPEDVDSTPGEGSTFWFTLPGEASE